MGTSGLSEMAVKKPRIFSCRNNKLAHQLAMQFAGVRKNGSCYSKLSTHPWHGILILELQVGKTDADLLALIVKPNQKPVIHYERHTLSEDLQEFLSRLPQDEPL